MWEYLAVLLVGFWLGVAIFLYVSCYWLEEILDLPAQSHSIPVGASSDVLGGASGAHAQLKRLVSRVVEEAAALPALARYAAEPPHMPSLESSTYEDLLATAILNKVIERYQTENGSGGRSSGIHSASASPTPSERSSPRALNSRHREISPPLREEEEDDEASDWEEGDASEEALDLPRRVPFPEFGGDIIHHTDNEERDFDEVSTSDIQAVDGSWEENWLFQKKKIKTLQSVPVPMLVPNSNTEYRALIGDRDADDTTDLSDNASDAEADGDYHGNIKRVLRSKHVIGGKTKIEQILDYEPDSLTFIDGSQDFEKLDEKEYMKSKDVVDAHHKNDNEKEEVENVDNNNSVLVLGIDSGPSPKAEFSMTEEIHRTGLNNNTNFPTVNGQPKNAEEMLGSLTNSNLNSIVSRHEREGEYEETVTLPVQRYADSLRRKHFDDEPQQIPTRDTDIEEELLPGTIAYRERKKWLNAVDMPNNPYSPEAIQRRLSAKNTSSLFDTLTAKSKDIDGKPNVIKEETPNSEQQSVDEPDKDNPTKLSLTIGEKVNGLQVNGDRSKSPSPKILKDVLAEEVPQYKRYGRDYYIKEAKSACGGRKRGAFSDTSSLSSMNKSMSLDNFDPDLASPVSASSSLSDLEASSLHQNIVRVVLSPRNASPNFAINPIFENPDKLENADVNHIYEHNIKQSANVREQSRSVCDEGDGFVENDDIVRLKIPKRPEITEDLFESYTNVRRSNTLRNEDLCVRAKRRQNLNYAFGGSLRLSKGFHPDLW